ncbi:hypothetical protein BpHYR1_045809 [Brachionus plicatilis]|uniref:Uncharacterized protein n=1 Tax=Brachionus plicatilis TaxID=10195 RepID=A0A3M7SYV7_BRAPC|nr:hypothetical protein BpHYR1_045809 [Brachionus plicatilis]
MGKFQTSKDYSLLILKKVEGLQEEMDSITVLHRFIHIPLDSNKTSQMAIFCVFTGSKLFFISILISSKPSHSYTRSVH